MKFHVNRFKKFWYRQAVPLTLVMLLSLAIMPRCLADEIPTSDDSKVEICVEQLREAPAVTPRYFGKLTIGGEEFERLQVGDKEFSEKFTSCLNAASQNGFSHILHAMVDNFSYGTRAGDEHWIEDEKSSDLRYIYVDAYQRKYVLDLKAKRSYDLVRIPVPGSIESMGTWTGTVTPVGGCKNSYGDPCGSTYTKSSAGYSLNK